MQIAPGVYSMGNWKGGQVRAFLLDDGHDLTLVDTLFETDGRLILNELRSIGRKPSDIKRIILSHAHRSHLGGLSALKRLSGAAIYAHEWEAGIVDGHRRAPRVSWSPMPPVRAYPLQLGLNLRLDKHPPCPVDEVLVDGAQAGPLTVVHTPGHTPGHLAFFWPERKLMVTGDIVATWPDLSPGWKGFTLDMAEHLNSVRRMAGFQPEILAVGHGDPVTQIGHEHLLKLVEQAGTWVKAG
jgi:glyoxylase-like metal-dependent hydrolase (beta-lactamase superfamily II)